MQVNYYQSVISTKAYHYNYICFNLGLLIHWGRELKEGDVAFLIGFKIVKYNFVVVDVIMNL